MERIAMKTSVLRVLLSAICLNVMLPIMCIGLLFSFQSPLSAAKPTGTNFLQNGGFENIDSTGFPSHWRIDAWQGGSFVGKSTLQIHTGKYSVLVESNTANDARAVQTIIVKPDTVYRLSGWIYAENVTSKDTGANLCLMNTGFHSGFYNVSEWRRAEMIFKTHKKQVTVDVAARLGFYSGTLTGRAFFDDISVEEVKEKGVSFNQLQEPAPVTSSTAAGSENSGTVYHLLIILFYICFLSMIAISSGGKYGSLLREIKPWHIILFIILLSAVVRIPLIMDTPFKSDFDCFKAWSSRMADIGPLRFYAKGYFCDYPPFALIILWPFGLLVKYAGLYNHEFMYDLVLKTPPFLCDLGTAWLIYVILKKKGTALAAVSAVFYAFLPPVLYDSAYWGQVDSIYALMIVGVFYLLIGNRPVLSAVLLAAAFFTKTQTVAFIPVILCVYFVRYKPRQILVSISTAVAFSFVIILPFYIRHPVSDVFDFYFKQAGTYPYIAFNAGNFMSLVFGNTSLDTVKAMGFLPTRYIGLFLFSASVAMCCYVYFRKKSEEAMAFAFFMSALCFFMFFPRMHERYLFAAFPFLVLSAGMLKDKVLFYTGAVLSVSLMMNMHIVILKYHNPKLMTDDSFERGLYIIGFISLAVLVVSGLRLFQLYDSEKSRSVSAFISRFFDRFKSAISESLSSKPFQIVRKDVIIVAGLLLLYTIFIFFRLGSSNTPQNGYRFDNSKKIVELTLPGNSHVDSIVWFDAEDTGKVAVEKYDGSKWDPVTMLDNKDYYVIKRIPVKTGVVTKLRLVPSPTGGMVNEIAFLDEKNSLVTPLSVTDVSVNKTSSPKDHPLFDEQSRVLAHSTHMNNTYFDEIYHGRTAYEFIKGYPVYEWTHPQLGKIILMPGIKIFGMNHFGMRFMHAVMGIVLILVLFFFGREVFSTRFGAFGVMIAGMLDFMPFAQSRYSTIDTTSVVFITLMFLFTVRYIKLESSGAVLKKKIIGIIPVLFFFALAAAVKWTAVYAFAGVFICTVIVKIGQIIDRKREGKGSLLGYLKKDFLPVLVFWIVLFALIVPVLYYIPYYYYVKSLGVKGFFSMESVNAIIKNQKDILAYHSNLTEPHSYSSRFWSWPFDFKPLFLYQMSSPPAGFKSSIVSFGNPIIWWTGLVAIFFLIYRFVADRKFTLIHYCLIMYACLYIPWSFVTRAAFIYHYYPLLPLLYLFVVTLLEPFWADRKRTRWIVVFFVFFAVFLFALFYPVLSGIEIPDWYNNMLKWYPKDWWWS
jgi:dolichyl-phosphate-mannose-protein mannosyltransferase